MTYASRTAPKFVVRYASPEQRDAIQAAADALHISDNSWIKQAIDEKLGRGMAIDHVISVALSNLLDPPMYCELFAALELMLSKAYKQNWNDNYPEVIKIAEDAIANARGVI